LTGTSWHFDDVEQGWWLRPVQLPRNISRRNTLIRIDARQRVTEVIHSLPGFRRRRGQNVGQTDDAA
jgi:hypothetical protein